MVNTVKSVTAKKISSINTFFDGEIKKTIVEQTTIRKPCWAQYGNGGWTI